jgi:hypothetical protein
MNREPGTAHREPGTAHREPGTAHREPRTANREPRTANCVVACALAVAAVVVLAPRPAAAQAGRYALLVEGASGEEQYATLHRGWLDTLAGKLRDDFGFDSDKLVVLAETPGQGELRATAENVKAAISKLSAQVKADDLLFVMLIGHGNGQGPDAKFNLIGPDLTVTEWSSLLGSVPGRLAFVDATSASFPYLAGLAGPGRVVITATNSYAQRFHTSFAGAFIEALGAAPADADKNGRISLLEAFTHASRLVAQQFEQDGQLSTEQALLDDTGDGAGRDAASEGDDGAIAALTYLDVAGMPTSSDPEVQQLIGRQAALTAQVDELRRNRRMLNAADFDREFERLMIELSLVSRDVRRRTGG